MYQLEKFMENARVAGATGVATIQWRIWDYRLDENYILFRYPNDFFYSTPGYFLFMSFYSVFIVPLRAFMRFVFSTYSHSITTNTKWKCTFFSHSINLIVLIQFWLCRGGKGEKQRVERNVLVSLIALTLIYLPSPKARFMFIRNKVIIGVGMKLPGWMARLLSLSSLISFTTE